VIESALHTASHFDVLATAAHYRVSAYDARYLVVARNLGVKLVTDDAKLRKSAPDLAQSLEEALGY
jgi:predicted nucleic acid-binding protein